MVLTIVTQRLYCKSLNLYCCLVCTYYNAQNIRPTLVSLTKRFHTFCIGRPQTIFHEERRPHFLKDKKCNTHKI